MTRKKRSRSKKDRGASHARDGKDELPMPIPGATCSSPTDSMASLTESIADMQIASRQCHMAQSGLKIAGQSNGSSSYLTMAELTTLQKDTHVVVDMSAMLRKKCTIYTTACTVLECIDMYSLLVDSAREATSACYREAFADCTTMDPDVIFHAMNTGGNDELKEWSVFSAKCLMIASYRYLVHNKTFPATLEGNPALLLTTRNRARVDWFWCTYFDEFDYQENLSDWKGATVWKSGRVIMSFHVEELGSDDPVYLDVSQYLDNLQLIVGRPRKSLIQHIHEIMARCRHNGPLNVYKAMYARLLKECAGYNEAHMQVPSNGISSSCSTLVVLDRLLNGKPFHIVREPVRLLGRNLENPGIESEYEPSTGPAEGGYEVVGDLIEGAGNKTVNLSFSDVEPDMVLYVNMSQELGLQTIIMKSHESMMILYNVMSSILLPKGSQLMKLNIALRRRKCASFKQHTHTHTQADPQTADNARIQHEQSRTKPPVQQANTPVLRT